MLEHRRQRQLASMSLAHIRIVNLANERTPVYSMQLWVYVVPVGTCPKRIKRADAEKARPRTSGAASSQAVTQVPHAAC